MLVNVRFVKITEYDLEMDIPEKDIERLKIGDGSYFYENKEFMKDFEEFGDEEWNWEITDPETFEDIVPWTI